MPTSTSIVHPSTASDSRTPQRQDEESAAGHMSTPDSDDAIDEQTAAVGLYENDEDVAEELDIAGQINEAERLHQHGE